MPTATTPAPTTTDAPAPPDPHTLQCLEIWGGNHSVDTGVSLPGLDAWVYSEPFEKTTRGGDVHYVSSCATGRIARILLADVAGHGDGSAGLASDLRDLMRKHVNSSRQSTFVRALNRAFSKKSDGYRFATGIVASYWGPQSKLTLTLAGHPLPLLFKAQTGAWSLLSPTGDADDEDGRSLPLGIDENAEYRSFDVDLEEGDTVLFYTDALIETDGEDGKLLGERGILEAAKKLDASDPATLITKLREVISPEIDRQTDQDDVTIMALRCNGNPVQTKPWSLLVGAKNTVKAMVGG